MRSEARQTPSFIGLLPNLFRARNAHLLMKLAGLTASQSLVISLEGARKVRAGKLGPETECREEASWGAALKTEG